MTDRGPAAVVIAATLDTKAEAVAVLREELLRRGASVLVVDCGVREPETTFPGVERSLVAARGGGLAPGADRAAALAVMTAGLAGCVRDLLAEGRVAGFVAVGGGTGASLSAGAFLELPYGLPKMLISTGVTGDVEPVVGVKDVMLVQPVVDLIGETELLDRTLRAAAAAMAAIVALPPPPARGTGPRVAITAFGVTSAAAEHAALLLARRGCRPAVFHARGSGGRAMEELIGAGAFDAVLDLTTTEVADEVVGGLRSAGPNRLEAAVAAGLPLVVVPGAVDVVNFGPPDTVPQALRGRPQVRHTPFSTLVRSSADDNREIAAWMAGKLAGASDAVVLVPQGGFSDLDRPDGPFHDQAADAAFADEITTRLAGRVEVRLVPAHINEPAFAQAACEALLERTSA
ncbi:Tm-1-like ATP-binding domain-containing protein [Nonomuraea sp. NPDC046802]|uniref:Tm-1-like ATP-binding domain-containing protein n=1 Tax=Nonomuraea sp. NPDC046802 TaxID=3154919 RepID=UPI0033FE9179